MTLRIVASLSPVAETADNFGQFVPVLSLPNGDQAHTICRKGRPPNRHNHSSAKDLYIVVSAWHTACNTPRQTPGASLR